MFLIRILLGILSIPFLIFSFLLKVFCTIVLAIGNIVSNILGGLMIIGAIIMFVTGDIGMGFGAIGLGALFLILPYIAGVIVNLLTGFIDLIISFVFHSR